MTEVDDRDLMLRVSKGSREAFSTLVDRYGSRLVTYFFRQGGDRDLAEDCAQEVFVRLYKARERYGPQSKFSTFLFTIARNYWIDVARSRRARPRETSLQRSTGDEDQDWSSTLPAEASDPMEQMETTEDVGRLHRALDRLPKAQRDVVLLGVIESLPYAEVSEILGIPVGTVKSRVHAAVQSLRGLLGAPSGRGGS